jgi:hypothetical protein
MKGIKKRLVQEILPTSYAAVAQESEDKGDPTAVRDENDRQGVDSVWSWVKKDSRMEFECEVKSNGLPNKNE